MTKCKNLIVLSLVIFFFYAQSIEAQDKKLIKFNGWEFLRWKISVVEAEKMLDKKGGDSIKMYSYHDNGYRTEFVYHNFKTYLYYDSLMQLSKVVQHKEFSIVGDKEADIFYKQTRAMLIIKYGNPDKIEDDKEKKFITEIWNLKYTVIILTYDYKYKIIDEFGCCSYTINVNFVPIK